MEVTERRFLRFATFTLIALYALIFIGGLVRATGSGMGCPDWPKCFGKLVPPTSVDELPENYLEVYVAKRKAKNERIANFMAAVGFPEVHDQIVAEAAVYQGEAFNPLKTWIEYINRLAGALIGLFILLTVFFSFPIRKKYPGILAASILGLVLTLVQAFLGSIVVSTNLIPATITMHMLFSLLMVGALLFGIVKVQAESLSTFTSHQKLIPLIWINLILGLVQIVLGTQIREKVDVLKINPVEGIGFVERLNAMAPYLELHRLLAFGLVISTILLIIRANKDMCASIVNFAVKLCGAIIALSMLTGIILYSYDIPAFAQPLHLTFGTILCGAHLLLLMVVWHSKPNAKQITPEVSFNTNVS
jgi:heme a synthase